MGGKSGQRSGVGATTVFSVTNECGRQSPWVSFQFLFESRKEHNGKS